MTTARFVRVGKTETDYVRLHDGDDCLHVNFADDWMFTKEERAACFRGKEGKTVAIPLHGPFFIGIDILPDEFEGSVGGLNHVKDQVRDTRWETHLENLFRDFRYAIRNLRKHRRFALVAMFASGLSRLGSPSGCKYARSA